MKKKQKVFLMVIFLIIICALNMFLPKSEECSVNFTISGTSDGISMLTVFYDNGQTDYPFDDLHMISNIVEITDAPQDVCITVPSESVHKIRIDFGEFPGVFTISDFKVIDGFHETFLSPEECTNKIKELNDIKEVLTSDSQPDIKIQVSGNDGYIYFENLSSDTDQTFNPDIIHILASVLITYIIYFFILLLIQKLYPQRKKINSLYLTIIAFFAFMVIAPYSRPFRQYFLNDIGRRASVLIFISLLLYLTFTITATPKDT